jgi:hypothetical protein
VFSEKEEEKKQEGSNDFELMTIGQMHFDCREAMHPCICMRSVSATGLCGHFDTLNRIDGLLCNSYQLRGILGHYNINSYSS